MCVLVRPSKNTYMHMLRRDLEYLLRIVVILEVAKDVGYKKRYESRIQQDKEIESQRRIGVNVSLMKLYLKIFKYFLM